MRQARRQPNKMNQLDHQKRQDAIRGLINLAALEGVLLVAVVLFYLQTKNITHLVGGVIGTSVFFAPLFFRWAKAHRGGVAEKTEFNRQSNSNLNIQV